MILPWKILCQSYHKNIDHIFLNEQLYIICTQIDMNYLCSICIKYVLNKIQKSHHANQLKCENQTNILCTHCTYTLVCLILKPF